MTAAQPGTAVAADGVDFVDENDARGVFLALLKEIANARSADADEHLDKVRTGNREKRRVRFAGNCAREERLARSRRSHQQNALRNLSAELGELLRLFEELDDLVELELGLVDSGHVFERDLLGTAGEKLCFRFSKRKRFVSAGLHLAHEKDPQSDQEQDRRPGDQRSDDRRISRRLELHLHASRAQLAVHVGVICRCGRVELVASAGCC